MKRNQVFIHLEVSNWDNTDLSSTLHEMCHFNKEYENDIVEVHQVVSLGKINNEWRYLIILNISRDLENLGELVGNGSSAS
ncbi:hypothetical protein [Paenisporosarcina sp. OV554]|uniref:hypothetical protein n=1 Tax=Paenisporosarcina sp. OV554 TaxID=2135694 RepID=UPI001E5EFAF7|nr:hypothetical protein [Paenisporosarcina sp. OV554]